MLTTLSRISQVIVCITTLITLEVTAEPLQLELPTKNRHLFTGEYEKFYMHTNRNFEGATSTPWQAGQYGFIRNLKRTPQGVIGTRFHEGIDIKPLYRDSNQKPTDLVSSIAKGKVVYINNQSKRSNYGKYVVVEHLFPAGLFYSLYAHLHRIDCQLGQEVDPRIPLGLLGYTGRGINRKRAHLHLEFNMMLSENFDAWHRHFLKSANMHSNYNGINMIGINVAALLVAEESNPHVNLVKFIQDEPLFYSITIPRTSPLNIAQRYPWLQKGNLTLPSPSWELSFSAAGIPLSIRCSQRQVTQPTVSFIKHSPLSYADLTKGYLSGSNGKASLSGSGKRFIALISNSFQKAKN